MTGERKGSQAIENKIRAYLDEQTDGNLYSGEFDAHRLAQLWTEAVAHNAITTPERLFYLGVDTLRTRLGKDWFTHISTTGHREHITATERFQRSDESVYCIFFYQPAFVSSSDFLSFTAQGGTLSNEQIEVVRTPISSKLPADKDQEKQRFIFDIGMPIKIPYRSRFYSEKSDEEISCDFGTQMHTLHQINLTPQEIQTFGRRLWLAHIHTPIITQTKSA